MVLACCGGGGWGFLWFFILPVLVFLSVLLSAILSAVFGGAAAWTGSRPIRYVAAGFDILGRCLTMFLAAIVILASAGFLLTALK